MFNVRYTIRISFGKDSIFEDLDCFIIVLKVTSGAELGAVNVRQFGATHRFLQAHSQLRGCHPFNEPEKQRSLSITNHSFVDKLSLLDLCLNNIELKLHLRVPFYEKCCEIYLSIRPDLYYISRK